MKIYAHAYTQDSNGNIHARSCTRNSPPRIYTYTRISANTNTSANTSASANANATPALALPKYTRITYVRI